MFKSLLSPRNNLSWTLFHIGLGALSTVTPFALIGWFYVLFFSNIGKALNRLQKGDVFLFMSLLVYLISFELLDRMAKTSPFLPFELGKYFLLFLAVVGIAFKGIRYKTGIVMTLLLVPAILFDTSGQRVFFDLVNNVFAPIAIGLGLALLYRSPIKSENMNTLLKLIWWTCLSSLIFTLIRTPDLDTISFDLEAQFETTGGHASNQVSTVLGLGMFLSFYSLINRLKFSGFQVADIGFMLLFAFQGLLSFSRGGMVIAAVGMAILFFFNNRERMRGGRGKAFVLGMLAVFGAYVVFEVADDITGGNLTLRYQGETQGTLLGSKEKSADVLVSGRLTILEEDIDVWLRYPILGAGAGSSRFLRDRTERVPAHTELSRLMAEHGILGIIYFILLLTTFYGVYKRLSKEASKGLFLALFLIALLTTFHAATRTFVSPVFFLLACLQVVPSMNKPRRVANPIHRGLK